MASSTSALTLITPHVRRRNLYHVVGKVGDGHELGQGRPAENAVVRERCVGDVKDDLVGAEVVGITEGDRKSDLPQRSSHTPVQALEYAGILQAGQGDL